MKKHIPFLRPNLVRREAYAAYLDQIDDSHIYSNYGPLNTRFEQRILNEFFKDQGALTTVANATLGLMLAISLCHRPGKQYAIMPSFTFAATPLAAMWCGLEPYFIDIDPDGWHLDVNQVEQTLKHLGNDVAVLIPYATFGSDIDLSRYAAWHDAGVPVVVDAASSLGTRGDKLHFGQGFPGTVVFSLHATKSFPIGEGGVVYSNNSEIIARLRRAANFGFTSERVCNLLGLNAKLSEMHAAVGLATLDVFDEKKSLRQRVDHWYHELFEEHALTKSGWRFQRTTGTMARQFVPTMCSQALTNQIVVDLLKQENIEARTYFRPACHQQPQFASLPKSSLQITESVAKRIVSLPLWEDMEHEDVVRVVATLAKTGTDR